MGAQDTNEHNEKAPPLSLSTPHPHTLTGHLAEKSTGL